MSLTVRLSPKTERALNALAKRRRLSRSDVVREAIERYGAADDGGAGGRPYDAWLDVIGVIALGVRDAEPHDRRAVHARSWPGETRARRAR